VFGSNNAPTDTSVTIPSLATQQRAYAEEQLKGLGLTVEVVQQFSADVDKNTVIKTDPAEGAKVEKNSTVKLYVSKGAEKIKVPDGLIGLSQEDAMKALTDANLRGTVKTRNSTKSQGTVIATSPKAGEDIEKNGTVTLFVPKELGEVPNLVGLTQEDATAQIKAAGFRVKLSEQPSDQPAGTVIQQNPPAGDKQPPGTTITIVVSTGPQDTAPPPTTDLPTDQPTDGQTDFPSDQPTADNPIGDDGLG
jgi:serine/threonine-protein kinase